LVPVSLPTELEDLPVGREGEETVHFPRDFRPPIIGSKSISQDSTHRHGNPIAGTDYASDLSAAHTLSRTPISRAFRADDITRDRIALGRPTADG